MNDGRFFAAIRSSCSLHTTGLFSDLNTIWVDGQLVPDLWLELLA